MPPKAKAFDIAVYCTRMETLLGNQDGPAALFWKALSFAVTAHQDQRRKSGEAYISHPLLVAQILVEELGITDPEVLAAAVLHDTIEDVPEISTSEIGELFGANVEFMVDACTKIAHYSGDRQNFYRLVHRKLFSGAAARLEVMLIKLADRLHNLRTLNSLPQHKRQKIAEETLDIYAPIAKVMGLYGIKRELYNLALMYKFPRQSQKVLAAIHRLAESPAAVAIKSHLAEEFEAAWISAEIRISPKGLWAYFDEAKDVLHRQIDNPLEIQVITPDIQTCYRVLGVVDQNYPPIPRTIRDFIANPKPTGYQSLHVRANIRGQNVLFKIRTPGMLTSSRTGLLKEWSAADHRNMGVLEREIREMLDILGGDEGISYRDMIAASGKKEIYTYTPKGDTIALPHHAIALDFAFKVHTEIGKRTVSARVGHREVPFDHVLQDGDRVEIITQKEPVRFEPDVQKLCQTAKARSELSKLFRLRREELASHIGQSILRQEFKRYGLPFDLLDKPGMEGIREYFGQAGNNDLFLAVGEGRLRLKELIYEIIQGLYAGRETLAPPTGSLNRIDLATLDPARVKFSRCCNPLPTEKGLYGLLSERGLSIHRKECRTMQALKVQREDVVEVRWRLKDTRVRKPQALVILEAPSRNRALMMLSVAPDDMRITDIERLSPLADRTSSWQIHFTVDTLQNLKHVLAHFTKSGLHYEFILEH
ncbi:MAG: HD domain-containing protein [Thermodesulfobacteriota bacterium]